MIFCEYLVGKGINKMLCIFNTEAKFLLGYGKLLLDIIIVFGVPECLFQ